MKKYKFLLIFAADYVHHTWSEDHKRETYNAPPECICITQEACLPLLIHCIFLRQIHKIRGEDQTQEANVQCRYQLLVERGHSYNGIKIHHSKYLDHPIIALLQSAGDILQGYIYCVYTKQLRKHALTVFSH